jgi:hypothetical protein
MDMALRFKSMEKAMTDVIIPALAGSHGLAVEQAQFLLFHLRLIGSQFDKELHLQLAELREAAGFVSQLVALVGDRGFGSDLQQARDALTASAPIVGLQLPTREHVIELVTNLKKAGDSILRQALDDTDVERRRQATELAMSYAERDITRRRVWVRQAGYDLEADQLPSIEQVLT